MNPRRNDPCPCGSGEKYKKCCGAVKSEPVTRGAGPVTGAPVFISAPANPLSKIDWKKFETLRNSRDDAHGGALAMYHLGTLFDGVKIGTLDFGATFRACMDDTETGVGPWKLIRRAQRAFNLARYFSRSLSIEGERAECGTYMGFSALLLARFARSRNPNFTGAGFHLVDSFEGLSQPTPQDEIRAELLLPGNSGGVYGGEKGYLLGALDHVQRVMSDYSGISIHKGWIPEVLQTLPETTWAFVHVDVDLYEPTLACLEYFVPRLAPGGILVNDDYASPLFPGGGVGWDEYCGRHHLAYLALDSGQAVLVKDV